MHDIQSLLELASARHSHLCPRQVLGVRMALAGAAVLQLPVPQQNKRLLIIAETDGCFLDGLEVASGATPGHRTLRVEDYGKVGATFVDTLTGCAVRLAPKSNVRELAHQYAPEVQRHYFAQLLGYQKIPDADLFTFTPVTLNTPIQQIVSRPGVRVNCGMCGEEIINEREIYFQGQAYCKACIGHGYYHSGTLGIVLPDQIAVNAQSE